MSSPTRVAIVLSTYNSNTDYLAQQIDSLLAQTCKPFITIRDDGSSDSDTLNYLHDLNEKFGSSVQIIYGRNKGFVASFMDALRAASPHDYYAFSDQDDYWEPNKLQRAVDLLDQSNAYSSETPFLYYGQFVSCDNELKPIDVPQNRSIDQTFENALAEASIPGMVMVFNAAMRKALLRANPQHLAGHDWFAAMIATGFGKTIRDDAVVLRYRRHQGNVSAGSLSPLELFEFRFKTFILGTQLELIRAMAEEYYALFADNLSEKDRELVSLYIRPNSFTKKLRKLFWKKRFRESIPDEVAYRLLFLLGKL